MNKEEDELLFLSKLYQTWPWCYDREAVIAHQRKIINMQHRKIAKIRGQEDIKNLQKKHKRPYQRKKEFQPTYITSPIE